MKSRAPTLLVPLRVNVVPPLGRVCARERWCQLFRTMTLPSAHQGWAAETSRKANAHASLQTQTSLHILDLRRCEYNSHSTARNDYLKTRSDTPREAWVTIERAPAPTTDDQLSRHPRPGRRRGARPWIAAPHSAAGLLPQAHRHPHR